MEELNNKNYICINDIKKLNCIEKLKIIIKKKVIIKQRKKSELE